MRVTLVLCFVIALFSFGMAGCGSKASVEMPEANAPTTSQGPIEAAKGATSGGDQPIGGQNKKRPGAK